MSSGTAMVWALRFATLLALLAVGWIMCQFIRLPTAMRCSERLILALAVCQLAAAYLLPRMHERYFFGGSVFVVLLLLRRWIVAVPLALLEASAMGTYHQYFRTAAYDTSRSLFFVPFLCLTLALIVLALWYRAQTTLPNAPVQAAVRS